MAATLLARHSWAAAAVAAALLLGVQEFEEFFYHWQFLQWSMGYGKFLGLLKLRRAFLPKLARSELLFFLSFIQFTTAKPSLKSENPEMDDSLRQFNACY